MSMGLQGAYGAAGAHKALAEILAARIEAEERQAKAQQQQLLNERAAAQEARAAAGEARTAALHPLNMMQQEAQLQPEPIKPEPVRTDLSSGQMFDPATRTMSMIPGFTPKAVEPPKTPEQIEEEAFRRARGARRGAPLAPRASAGPQLGMSTDQFKWIQTLPSTDKDIATATQKALKYVHGDPQKIVQAVREAYGMTARPTATEQGRVPADVRLRLQTELSNWDLEAADLDDAEFAEGRQRIIETILGNAGLPR